MSKVVVALTPLHHDPFRRLWLGQGISLLGDQFTTIALLWFVLQLTGSGAAVGLVILCFQPPCVVTGPLLGRLLDRVQPRVLMGIDNLVRALLIGAIPSLYLLKVLSLWHIYALALLAGALSPATQAGVRVVLPYLVADHELEQANALSSASEQFAYLIGPALAGVVVSKVGGPLALLLDASSFLLMGLLVLSLPTVLPTVGQERAAARGQWFGFGLLWRMKEVRLLTALSLVFFFSYGPLEAALPLYSRLTLHTGAEGYGVLWSGFGVGALAGVLFLTRLMAHWHPGIMLPLIAVLWGLLLCPLAVIPILPIAMLFLGLAGSAWAPYTPIQFSYLQRLIPPHLRGQVFGARLALTTTAAPLGAVTGGILLGYLSPPVVVGLSGIACILAGVGGLLSPTMRGLDGKTKSMTR